MSSDIKFEYEMSKSEISFLDASNFKVDNKLWIKEYVKPADRQNKSEHPNSTKKSTA